MKISSWIRRHPLKTLALVALLSMGAVAINDGTTLWKVDTTSQAGRTTAYDTAGNTLSPTGTSAISSTIGGLLQGARDYKIFRTLIAGSDGALRVTKETVFLSDPIEGNTRNSNIWIETATTMTSSQTAPSLTLNAGASVATTVGIQEVSHRSFPRYNRSRLIFKTRARDTAHFNNNLIERGFGNPASVTGASIADGCVWRKDGTGQYLPVVSFAGSETLGTPISNATFVASVPTTDFATFEVHAEGKRCTFIITTSLGVLVNQQTVDFPATVADFTVSHLFAMHRTYNSAGTGTAVQVLISETTVYLNDLETNKPWSHQMSGIGNNFTTNPTTYAQAATWANSANPAAVTISNTTCGVSTLGGLVNMNAIAGATTTDLCLVGFQVPSPYTFYFTGIRIGPPQNLIVAVATSQTVFTTFGVAFNSSAASLATAGSYPPMRVALGGMFRCALAAVAGDVCSGVATNDTANFINWFPGTPVAVYPGRFLHVIVRVPIGTATATETFLFNVAIDGYFQ
jgi:hypothetical protein